MYLMFFLILGIDKDNVDKDEDELVEIWFAVHEVHEDRWCVGQSEWHNQKLVMAIPGLEGGFWDVFFLNRS